MATATAQQLQDKIARLEAQNEILQAKATRATTMSFKVSQKGAVSVYGLGRWPVTLYASQWDRFLQQDNIEALRDFIVEHRSLLSIKE